MQAYQWVIKTHTRNQRKTKQRSAKWLEDTQTDRPVIDNCAKFAHGSFKFNKSAGEEGVIVRAVPY